MKSNQQDQKTNMITVTIPSKNTHSIPVFEDFMAEAQRRYQVEMDAKNEAYSFILSTGQLQKYAAFCKSTRGINHHANCVDHLALITPSQQ